MHTRSTARCNDGRGRLNKPLIPVVRRRKRIEEDVIQRCTRILQPHRMDLGAAALLERNVGNAKAFELLNSSANTGTTPRRSHLQGFAGLFEQSSRFPRQVSWNGKLRLPGKAFIEGEAYEHILRGEEELVREYCKLDLASTLLVFLSRLRSSGDLATTGLIGLAETPGRHSARGPLQVGIRLSTAWTAGLMTAPGGQFNLTICSSMNAGSLDGARFLAAPILLLSTGPAPRTAAHRRSRHRSVRPPAPLTSS